MIKSRRKFLSQLSIAGLSLSALPETFAGQAEKNDPQGFTFLFQGDSITDGNRTRNKDWNHILGHGFMYLIASKLYFENTDKNLLFINRGVSGNKITDLEKRWLPDTLDLKPNVLSILVGVNDAHSVVRNQNPENEQVFEESYRRILKQSLAQNPDLILILCEPFVLPVGNVNNDIDLWYTEIKKRQQIVKKLALEFKTLFIPFQSVFDKACEKAPADFWSWDGIHPMPAGHELMAREWIRIVGKKINF